jgi:hypothetical protein
MDIDIDFQNRDQALSVIKHIIAARKNNQEFLPHNTGIYLQNIPHDLLTNMATIDYKLAEERGYFKIDFLNVNVYNGIRNEDHLKELMSIEPLWDLLEQDDFIDLLFQAKGNGRVLRKMKPTNIEQLAAVLAMIRPAKQYLIGKSWDEIFEEIWIKPNNEEYYWKKSHAIAYAMAVIVQMNLICESISYEGS